jgi:ribosomal protein S6--L-glutamate ligase
MNLCFIVDRPDHPVITATAERLALEHRVSMVDARALRVREARTRPRAPRMDVYLLKSGAPAAIARARELEGRGARVVNTPAATEACRDRVLMAKRLADADLPRPRTAGFASLLSLRDGRTRPTFPLVVKSRYSRRGDLVAKVPGVAELRRLALRWPDEPIVVQEFVANDGIDWKLWVIGGNVAAARRRTALEEGRGDDLPVQLDRVPTEWLRLAREIGTLFGLELYGVDLVETERGPIVVDVNAFPGYRSVRGAPETLAGFIDGAFERGSAAGRSVW